MNSKRQEYRKLTTEEISQLIKQGCRCDAWHNITVKKMFTTEHVNSVTFSGTIELGLFDRFFELPCGVRKHSGISNCTLHNVNIGDNVYIDKITGYIANYNIDKDTFIESVHIISTDNTSTFGNGLKISAINEAGGREIPIFNKLSAQLAYIIATHRYRPNLITALTDIITSNIATTTSETGTIGKSVVIQNTGSINSTNIGDYTTIDQASQLTNGSINSNFSAPAYIGAGVICKDFIISSGSKIDSRASLIRCFVGQSVTIGNGFSATDSLFFANSHLEQGEACSVFAGPFTVSHHKSTLLIAGLFSFMNAGSGTNQSNHMYKSGPVHQGILERGTKTGSGSYLLWPAKIGAFSIVMGIHKSNPDTSFLPFSYIVEDKGVSIIIPAANIKNSGMMRDANKWIKRDVRNDPDLRDIINSKPFTPYTVQNIIKGLSILKNLTEKEKVDKYQYNGGIIESSAAYKGILYYELALNRYFSEIISLHLDATGELKKPKNLSGSGIWCDICGLIAPLAEIRKIEDAIESGEITTIEEIENRFSHLNNNYLEYEWSWAYNNIESLFGIDPALATAEEISGIISTGQESKEQLSAMIYENAAKEYSSAAMIGFGLDEDGPSQNGTSTQVADFKEVRGSLKPIKTS